MYITLWKADNEGRTTNKSFTRKKKLMKNRTEGASPMKFLSSATASFQTNDFAI